MARSLEFIADEKYDGSTVLRFLLDKNVSQRLLRRLKLEEKGITANGVHIRTIDRLKSGDKVVLNLKEDIKVPVPTIGIIPEIIYEDNDILVFNKPPFMAVHQTRGHYTDTLSNYASYYMEQKNERGAFRAVNRLDKNTSGVVIDAKHQYAANNISKNMQKKYIAVVSGEIKEDGKIVAPIKRKQASIIEREVAENGAYSETRYKVIMGNKDITFLEIELITGRTHQIRVHFAYIGHAIIGDTLYGTESPLINRQALHCKEIIINHPITNKKISLKAKMPGDIKKIANFSGFLDI